MTDATNRYFNPHQTSNIGNLIVFVFDDLYAIVLVGLAVILIFTRVLSSRHTKPSLIGKDGIQTVPAAPYWLPYIGHIPNMALETKFMLRLKRRFNQGIFSVVLGGKTCNVIYDPHMVIQILNQKPSIVSHEEVPDTILRNVFGLPKKQMEKYKESEAELTACYKHLLSEPSLGDLVKQTAHRLQRDHLKDFVTGNESVVDQMPWERTSGAHQTTDKFGSPVTQVELFPLVRNFVAFTTIPSIMGSDFLDNFPEFVDLLWSVDNAFLLLATGMPRWVPIPALTKAHIARKQLLHLLYRFHEALEKDADGKDPGPQWGNLHNVGTLVKARRVVYRKYGLSIETRAAIEHSLLWATIANANPLIFWMIEHIYADKALLEMIREEIQPYAQIIQPRNNLAIAEPPRLEKFDLDGLCSKCPLFKSCYVECMRLDTAIWNMRVIKEDIVLQSRDRSTQNQQAWLLRKGELIQVAQDLHSTDPNFYPDPLVFKADRHIRYEGQGTDKTPTVELGLLRPYGMSHVKPNSCVKKAYRSQVGVTRCVKVAPSLSRKS